MEILMDEQVQKHLMRIGITLAILVPTSYALYEVTCHLVKGLKR